MKKENAIHNYGGKKCNFYGGEKYTFYGGRKCTFYEGEKCNSQLWRRKMQHLEKNQLV